MQRIKDRDMGSRRVQRHMCMRMGGCKAQERLCEIVHSTQRSLVMHDDIT